MSGAVGPTYHQDFQNFPKLDAPFVDEGNRLHITWYRLLINLWMRTGGHLPISKSAALTVDANGNIVIVQTATNTVVGYPIVTTTVVTSITTIVETVYAIVPQDAINSANLINGAASVIAPVGQVNAANLVNFAHATTQVLAGP